MNPPRRLSKRPSLLSALLAAALSCLVWIGVVSAHAERGRDAAAPPPGYELSWFTVDGGGLTWSTGGGYKLGGSIGQPDAQALAQGGGYRLQGGFWRPVAEPPGLRVYLPLVLR